MVCCVALKNKKIALINNTKEELQLPFDYKIENVKDVNVKNINKQKDLLKKYDFVLIYEPQANKDGAEK